MVKIYSNFVSIKVSISLNFCTVIFLDYISKNLCINYSILIGVVVLWIIIQLVFVVTCWILVRRYKKYYKDSCIRQSLEKLDENYGIGYVNLDNNLDHRRVHFADGEYM